MDAKVLEEGRALLAERSIPALENLADWLWTHKDELIADAGRWNILSAGFRIMSPKMDCNHVWTWSHHPKLIGPNMKVAIDTAIAAGDRMIEELK